MPVLNVGAMTTDDVVQFLRRINLDKEHGPKFQQQGVDGPVLQDLIQTEGGLAALGVTNLVHQSKIRARLLYDSSRPDGPFSVDLNDPPEALQLALKHGALPAHVKPVMVDAAFSLDRLGSIDTFNMQASVKLTLTLSWRDARVAYWKGAQPTEAWGFEARLLASVGRLETSYGPVIVQDATAGVLRRQIYFEGTVAITMDARHFPFDSGNLVLRCIVSEGAIFKMASERGEAWPCSSEAMQVRPLRGPGALRLARGAHIAEFWLRSWTVRSWSEGTARVDDREVAPEPSERGEHVELSLCMARRAATHFWRILLPLYLLSALSFAPLALGDRTSDRVNWGCTTLLATVVLLHAVVGQLPRSDAPSSLDWAMALALVLQVRTAPSLTVRFLPL